MTCYAGTTIAFSGAWLSPYYSMISAGWTGLEDDMEDTVSTNLDTSESSTVEKVSDTPPKMGGLAQGLDQPVDALDVAMRAALTAATTAGQWGIVEALAGQLAKRSAVPAGIIRLVDRRKP